MDPDKDSEEFSNFMYRATEVNSIVKQLCSKDDKDYEVAQRRADDYLGKNDEKELLYDESGEVQLHIRNDRSIINKEALRDCPGTNSATMEVDAFKREIEKDAAKRYHDKRVRKERAETLKVQGNKAFRRGEYERALSCYSKAIDQIRDSPLLYTNRALTLLKLGLWQRARNDCETAIKIEASGQTELKALLYSAQASHALDEAQTRDEFLEEASTKHPGQRDFIQEYARDHIFVQRKVPEHNGRIGNVNDGLVKE